MCENAKEEIQCHKADLTVPVVAVGAAVTCSYISGEMDVRQCNRLQCRYV